METITTEIRQPYSLPITIHVPDYPRLAELKAQQQRLAGAVNDYQSRLATLTRENILLNQQAESVNASQQVFDRLVTLKHEAIALENELAAAQFQANRVEDERRQWVEQFAWNLHRRQLLSRELAEVKGLGPLSQMQTTSLGKARLRTKIEILSDLDQALKWLSAFSGDEELTREALTIQAQLAEAYQSA